MIRALAGAGTIALLASFMGVVPASSQSRSTFIVAGYGTATYEGIVNDDYVNDFSASVSPVLLYSMGGDVLFEAELEFGLSGDLTTTTLEYAQLDYTGFDHFQIVAGKFLLPFGVFGERLHPSWVNKLPSSPILFGHAHGGVAEGALLPILSDAGVMLRWARPFGSGWSLDFSGWVSQGPRIVEEGEEEGDGHAHLIADPSAGTALDGPGHLEASNGEALEMLVPSVGFGVAFRDNNENKMVGGRLGVVKGPSFEAYVSGFHAMYDPESFLDYKAGALSAEWRRGTFEVRGEGVLLRQEFEEEETVFRTLEREGFYLQASKRFGSWEPVARFGHMADAKVGDTVVEDAHSQFAIGLDYWLDASIPLKVAWEFHEKDDDRFLLQWAFGF